MKPIYGEELVNELRKKSDSITQRLWIAVPYIGGIQSVRRILGKHWIQNRKLSIRLLTDTNDFNNFNSGTIRVFAQIGEIRHLAGLHAKIYIMDNTSLITSANLTNTAFSKRHEIGIFLNGANSNRTKSIFEAWWKKSEPVSEKTLKKFRKKRFISDEERAGSGLRALWSLPDDPGEADYWFKPIGVTGDPITEDRIFADKEEKLHFSKLRPKGVKTDDILIAYGVGAKRILSIYKVISNPKFDAKNKRWPWYVIGRNLTLQFGKKWATHNIYANDLLYKYLQRHPKKSITKVGGKSFGGLNLGKDKLKLDPDFAEYIIRRITKLNTK